MAVSRQTGETRVVFTENSGLSVVHPVDAIDEVIDVAVPVVLEERRKRKG